MPHGHLLVRSVAYVLMINILLGYILGSAQSLLLRVSTEPPRLPLLYQGWGGGGEKICELKIRIS